jgi:hypothetical protein
VVVFLRRGEGDEGVHVSETYGKKSYSQLNEKRKENKKKKRNGIQMNNMKSVSFIKDMHVASNI